MNSDISAVPAQNFEKLLNSLVVPRPIAWVTTVSADGVGNLAPFSYFNVAAYSPPILMISFSGSKHTLANIEATGEFAVHTVNADMAESMVQSSADYPPEVNEIETLGLESKRCNRIHVSRLLGANACFECTMHSNLKIGQSTVVFGEIIHFHVHDTALTADRVNLDVTRPVGRLGGSGYCVAHEDLKISKPSPFSTD